MVTICSYAGSILPQPSHTSTTESMKCYKEMVLFTLCGSARLADIRGNP